MKIVKINKKGTATAAESPEKEVTHVPAGTKLVKIRKTKNNLI